MKLSSFRLRIVLQSLFLLCLWQGSHAQHVYKDTLYLKEVNNENLTEYYSYYIEPAGQPLTPESVDSSYQRHLFRRWKWHQTLNPGHVSTAIWLRIAVRNTLSAATTFLWSGYNLVDSMCLYRKDENSFRLLGAVSAFTLPSERLYTPRNLSLPFTLKPYENAVLYLKITNPDAQLYQPSDITTVQDYLAYEGQYFVTSNWYFLFGFFLFAFVFNLILYLFLKDVVHIWYAAYAVSTLIFLLMEDGLAALIFPDSVYVLLLKTGQFSFLLLSAGFSIGVMQVYIRQQRKSLLFRMGRRLVVFDVGYVLLYMLVYSFFNENKAFAVCLLLNRIRDIALAASVLFTVFVLVGAMKKGNKLAYYYGSAYLFFLAGSAIFSFNYNGITNIHFIEPNELAIGLFLELLFLLFLITIRFQLLMKENSSLKIEELERQKRSAAQLILAQDEERQRLARDLHDDLGGTVARIRMLLLKMQEHKQQSGHFLSEMQELVKKAASDVRNISHELMPVDLQQKGLFLSMQNMAAFLSSHSGVVFRFFSKGVDQGIPHELQLVIYRIFNELTSNIVKHAVATQAELQCILYDDYLLLSAEDNGKGIKNQELRSGIGLKNIRNRVEYLHGKMNIDSSDSGTTIIIEIPLTHGT